MDEYIVVAKIVDSKGVIIGYRLKNKIGRLLDVSLREAQRYKGKIKNGYIGRRYFKLYSGDTRSLPRERIKSRRVIEAQRKKKINGFRDFSYLKPVPLMLEGITNKILVEDTDGSRYIIKVGKEIERTGGYFKDYISEFIGCKIAKQLGYSVQEVELGYYKGKECVAIKYFGYIPTTFKGLGYSTLEEDILNKRDNRYNLDWLLNLRITKDKFGVSEDEYKDWVIKVFVLDMFIGNYDRHENNWGFKRYKGKYIPSPLFDMGASLFSKEMDDVVNWTDGKIKHEIENRVRSAIMHNGKKKGYFALLDEYVAGDRVRKILLDFISRAEAEIDRLGIIFSDVVKFNREYDGYVRFISKMLRMKLKLLRRYK